MKLAGNLGPFFRMTLIYCSHKEPQSMAYATQQNKAG